MYRERWFNMIQSWVRSLGGCLSLLRLGNCGQLAASSSIKLQLHYRQNTMIYVNQLCRSRLFCPCFCSCTLGALAGAGAGRGAVAIAAGASEGFVGLPLGCSACNTEGGRSGDTGRCWPKLFWLGRCGGPCLAVWPGGDFKVRWEVGGHVATSRTCAGQESQYNTVHCWFRTCCLSECLHWHLKFYEKIWHMMSIARSHRLWKFKNAIVHEPPRGSNYTSTYTLGWHTAHWSASKHIKTQGYQQILSPHLITSD